MVIMKIILTTLFSRVRIKVFSVKLSDSPCISVLQPYGKRERVFNEQIKHY
jgi:hypothetical protein